MHRTQLLGDKAALVVVDVQRKFSIDRPDWEEIRDKGVAGMNRYMDMFRRAGRPVILMAFEGETHNPYNGDDGDDNDWNEIELYTDESADWDGTITNVRLDPMVTEGDFALSYIRFLKVTEKQG